MFEVIHFKTKIIKTISVSFAPFSVASCTAQMLLFLHLHLRKRVDGRGPSLSKAWLKSIFCYVIAAMLEGKNNTFFLLWEIRSIFMQNCFIVSDSNMAAVKTLYCISTVPLAQPATSSPGPCIARCDWFDCFNSILVSDWFFALFAGIAFFFWAVSESIANSFSSSLELESVSEQLSRCVVSAVPLCSVSLQSTTA